MKIAGIDPKTLPIEALLVLPRGEQNLVFRARGVKDMDEFDLLCPAPKPPGRQTREGWKDNLKDKTYMQVLEVYNKKRLGYLVTRSLMASCIEWDTVQMEDPASWNNWQTDLLNSGLTQVECNRVLGLVMEANALDEAKIIQARESFLAGLAMMPESSGPLSDQQNT